MAPIPAARIAQIRAMTTVLGDDIAGKLPFAPGVRALSDSPVELALNNTWRPTLAVTGAAGLPALENAGNVLLPRLEVKLSFRLPPAADAAVAASAVKRVLESSPPYGARVRFDVDSSLAGWDAPVPEYAPAANHQLGRQGTDPIFVLASIAYEDVRRRNAQVLIPT